VRLAIHADPTKASRPFDKDRNGIVISEGGCIYTLERLDDALRPRRATSTARSSATASTFDAARLRAAAIPRRQAECVRARARSALACGRAISTSSTTHATATPLGDIQECERHAHGLRRQAVPTPGSTTPRASSATRMGAAGALELAGNLPSFEDRIVHPTINVDDLDPQCAVPASCVNQPERVPA
jgi:3-oxoacyl-[acyl-carrier-protein] synthase II